MTKRIVMDVGEKFGRWTIVGPTRKSGPNGKKITWLCVCDCGFERYIYGTILRSGTSKSCGCAAHDASLMGTDYTGKRFGCLTSMGRSERTDKSNSRVWENVKCDCGCIKVSSLYSLLDGSTLSCGCKKSALISAKKTKHGHGKGTPTYRSYMGAIQRCTNPNQKRWDRYGGRGIRVCERWMESFENFLVDMGERPGAGFELDRQDNDGDYEPKNCRWVSRRVNLNNTSQCKPTTAFGRTLTLAQWSRETGINRETISGRLSRGWSVERAISEGATMVNDLNSIKNALVDVDLTNNQSMRNAISEINQIIKARLDETPLGNWAKEREFAE